MKYFKHEKKKAFTITLVFILLLSLLTACTNKNSIGAGKYMYNGKELKIGVIGKAPKVREKQINFSEITFNDLENENIKSKYNAIFITKDNLQQASENKYTPIYIKTQIPIFFIESKKGNIPFILEDMSYKDVPVLDDLTYATGLIYDDNSNYTGWEYGLYNDTKNQININGVYSRIFETISKNDN